MQIIVILIALQHHNYDMHSCKYIMKMLMSLYFLLHIF